MTKYLEGTDAQKSRAYSPAVITEGGRIVWLAGQTATVDGDGKDISGNFEAQSRAERSIPLGRICTPEEVANVAVFVASPRASFMNGAIITLDGGQRKALLD